MLGLREANNLFVFPAIALAAHLGQTKIITDEMLMVAAEVSSPVLACCALPHHVFNTLAARSQAQVQRKTRLMEGAFPSLAEGRPWAMWVVAQAAVCMPAFNIDADHRHDVCGQALPLTIKDEDLKRGCVYPSLYDIRRAMCLHFIGFHARLHRPHALSLLLPD